MFWEISFHQWPVCMQRENRMYSKYQLKQCTEFKMARVDSKGCYELHVETCSGPGKYNFTPTAGIIQEVRSQVERTKQDDFQFQLQFKIILLLGFFPFCLFSLFSKYRRFPTLLLTIENVVLYFVVLGSDLLMFFLIWE